LKLLKKHFRITIQWEDEIIHLIRGGTRYIILLDHKVIKIGLIRPFRPLLKAIALTVSAKRRAKYRQRHGSCLKSIQISFMEGILANRLEHQYSSTTHDPRVVWITDLKLFGMIAISHMPGKDVSEEELQTERPFGLSSVLPDDETDLYPARQYCRCQDGKIRIVDFGKPPACELLMRTLDAA
jgi:hypothetical protein